MHGIFSISRIFKLDVTKAPGLLGVVVQRNVHVSHVSVLGEELAEVLWFGLVGDVAYKEGGGALTFRGTSGGVARHGLRV